MQAERQQTKHCRHLSLPGVKQEPEEESTSLPANVTDDSCRLELIEIVPLTRDSDGHCTTECDSRDWSGEVKQENLPVVKQEPEEVCYTGLLVTE